MDITEIVRQAKRTMLRQGEHHPQIMIEDTRGVYIALLDFLPATTLEKQKLLFKIGNSLAMDNDIEASSVKQLVWICEAWFSSVPVQEAAHAPSPSKDPHRREGLIVLTLTIKDRQLSQEMQMVEVIRQGGILDLLPRNEPMKEVRSGLLTSCLAGIVAASLSDDAMTMILDRYRKGD